MKIVRIIISIGEAVVIENDLLMVIGAMMVSNEIAIIRISIIVKVVNYR